jgi:uncharacterized protein YecE (DUF72 family)
MSGAIHVGTSGWHYKHWRSVFYPADLKPRDWLRYYAARLSCVELNNSFYRIPSAHNIELWAGEAPAGFRFAVKAWGGITHRKRLHDCAALLDAFLQPVLQLGRRLGPILFQLPPRWPCNPERLRDFLAQLPRRRNLRYAFEFRDPSWHNADIYRLLAEYDAAFCLFELGGQRTRYDIATADLVYVRLHGPAGRYGGDYSAAALRRWADRLRGWRDEGRDVWLFFDNDQAGYAVKNAIALRRRIEPEAE